MKTDKIPAATESTGGTSKEDRLYIGITGLALVGLMALLFFALY